MNGDRFKFRYWHTKENRYIYTHCDCLAIKNTVLYSLIGKPNKNGWFETDIEKAYNDFELIPEQCTGLKDKNGNLIYEGDIVSNGYKTGVVKYGEFNCSCCDGVYGWYFDDADIRDVEFYEIIGNIHDQKDEK